MSDEEKTTKPISDYTYNELKLAHNYIKAQLFTYRYGSLKEEDWPNYAKEMQTLDIEIVAEVGRRRNPILFTNQTAEDKEGNQ